MTKLRVTFILAPTLSCALTGAFVLGWGLSPPACSRFPALPPFFPTLSPQITVTTYANVTNSPKSGIVNQPYRKPPDPYGNYQHSFHEQLQGNQPVVVQAEQLAKVS